MLKSVKNTILDIIRQADLLLLALCTVTSLFGVVMIYSATRYDPDLHSLAAKQGVALAAGVGLCLVLQPFSYGAVDVRVAEALCVLPVFGAEYSVGVTLGCFLANLLGSTVIDVIFGTLATLLACLVTYKLRDVRIKGLAIPASLPPVIFNMIIVGAFEITFFFSDSAPTAAMAAFNAVTVGIGEVISCTILGVALVKLIETNASLKKIFTEE